MKNHFSHGEVVAFDINEIPKGAKLINPIDGRYILADSENSGNHHCLEAKDGVEVYEKDGVFYVRNTVQTTVFCVVKDRHDTEVLTPGIREFDKAREYDFLTDETKKVSD